MEHAEPPMIDAAHSADPSLTAVTEPKKAPPHPTHRTQSEPSSCPTGVSGLFHSTSPVIMTIRTAAAQVSAGARRAQAAREGGGAPGRVRGRRARGRRVPKAPRPTPRPPYPPAIASARASGNCTQEVCSQDLRGETWSCQTVSVVPWSNMSPSQITSSCPVEAAQMKLWQNVL